jgi:hypothetical protein
MTKRTWKNSAYERVVGIVLIIIVLALLAHSVLVHNNPPHYRENFPTASSSVISFANPYNNSTNVNRTSNGGGWIVKVVSISSNATGWGASTIQISNNGMIVTKLPRVKPQAGVLWQNNGTSIPKWYAKEGGSKPLMVNPKGGAKVVPTPGASGTGVAMVDLMTMEGAFFIVIDVDGNNLMDPGDQVIVFANSKGGNDALINGTGYTLDFVIGGEVICSSPLG